VVLEGGAEKYVIQLAYLESWQYTADVQLGRLRQCGPANIDSL